MKTEVPVSWPQCHTVCDGGGASIITAQPEKFRQ